LLKTNSNLEEREREKTQSFARKKRYKISEYKECERGRRKELEGGRMKKKERMRGNHTQFKVLRQQLCRSRVAL
jgi:hypothetical protein